MPPTNHDAEEPRVSTRIGGVGVGAGLEPGPPADGLDRLRDALLQRLDQIEELAAEQAARLEQGTSERERALRERVTQLEASQSRLQAEIKRREQDWQDLLSEIEDDRRLLTEAWERLEREQVDAAAANPAAANPAGGPYVRAPVAERPAAAAAAAVAARERDADDPVTRDILWQFQALKNDVRRNAKGASGR